MKKVYLFTSVLLITLFTNVMLAQSLLLEENFDYLSGELLTANGWTAHSGAGTNPVTVVSPGLTFAGYIASGVGNAAGINNTGEDVNKQFTQQTSGVIYAAFIVQTQSSNSTGYFFHLGQYTIGTTYFSRVWVNATGDGLGIGGTTPANWVPITPGTPTLVVVKYDMASKISSLFVFNSFPNSEPITPDATFTETATVSNVGSVALRQYNASQRIVVDGIRIATTWQEAVKAPDTQAPVATFNPADAEFNVAITVNPTITFDEPIRNIDNSVIDNSNVAMLITFKETGSGGVDIPFTASIDGTNKTITITPTSNLLFNQTYYLAIAPVEDQYDNATTSQSITFTTELASNEAEITSFNIPNQISSTINSTNATVDVIMPYGTDVTNLTPAITISAGATINPASGVAQNFTNPVTYTVTAQDGITTKNWTVTVTTQLNNEADILTFDIPNQVSSTINTSDTTVTVLMPYGTDVTNLTPTITLSPGATVSPASGVAQDFTNPVSYTVTAQDGITTKVWTVTVTTQLNNEADILTFDIPNQVSSTINTSTASVDILMPQGTDVTNLTPAITISADATINPASGVAQDFTNPVSYTVTAQDGTTKVWTVSVNIQMPTIETIVEWTFPNNPDDSVADGGITPNLNRILTTNSSGTVTYVPATGATSSTARNDGWNNGMDTKYWMIDFTTVGYKDITLSSKQRSSNTGPRDFKAQYSLNGTTWNDITTILVANNFTSGVLTDMALPTACNNQNIVYVRWIMSSDTAVNGALVASTGASNIDDIYVKGVAFLSSDAEILSFDIPNQVSSTINSSNATVDIVMPYGTNVSNLTPAIVISAGATINPASGVAQDFTNPVQYTVTAADATTKIWTVSVTVETASSDAEILTFTIPGQLNSSINSLTSTVDVIMPLGTDLSNLIPSITISAGATINPASGVAQNFTNPVTYTVTAQDGITTKNWTVTVTTQLNNEADILTFDIPNQVSSTINTSDTTVTVLMPYGTDVTNLTPTITLSLGATVSPASGVAQDFTNPVQYTVTAENGLNQKVWTVFVVIDNPIFVSIAEWTFPNNPDDSLADGGITANLDKIITNTATGTTTYTFAGASSYCARATGWDAGMDTKYWQVDFTTQGYEMIRFSSKQRSSNTGPRDFKVQYMINNDGNWQDVPNASVSCADNWTAGVLNDIELPAICDQKNLVSLRWIMTSDSSVSNSIVASTGSSRIDDIIVKGVEHSLSVQTTTLPTITIYPNPTNHWLHIHSNEKVLDVNIISIDGKVIPVMWNNDAIDVQSLPTGMYILNISTLSKNYKLNFIKQ